jgi:predicted amidohydrolase
MRPPRVLIPNHCPEYVALLEPDREALLRKSSEEAEEKPATIIADINPVRVAEVRRSIPSLANKRIFGLVIDPEWVARQASVSC